MDRESSTIMYAVRHGETVWNRAGKMQGWHDSPLTELGISQAKATAQGMEGRGVEQIYVSDLKRAIDTANIIAEVIQVDVKIDKRLRERNMGEMEGLTHRMYGELYPEKLEQYLKDDPSWAIPGGESLIDRCERCVSAANDICSRHKGQTILIVGHGGVLSSFIQHTVGLDLSQPRCYSLFNACISRFTIDNHKWVLDTWGDISHMKHLEVMDDN